MLEAQSRTKALFAHATTNILIYTHQTLWWLVSSIHRNWFNGERGNVLRICITQVRMQIHSKYTVTNVFLDIWQLVDLVLAESAPSPRGGESNEGFLHSLLRRFIGPSSASKQLILSLTRPASFRVCQWQWQLQWKGGLMMLIKWRIFCKPTWQSHTLHIYSTRLVPVYCVALVHVCKTY